MKTRLVSALYDINRETKGDGRKIKDYLSWLKETLKLKCDLTIFTEEKFKEFIIQNRTNGYDCDIIVQDFDKIPFYKFNSKIKEILESPFYKYNMKDTNRIECYLSEYNVIQYSKFEWIKNTIIKNPDYEYYFWVDAGISRFFNGFDLNQEWPNPKKLKKDKIVIQGNYNYIRMYPNLDIEKYIWDNNCLLSGGLFGGGKEVMSKLYDEVNNFVDFLFLKNCFNNEQFSFPIISKKNPEMFDVLIHNDGTPMPIFKLIS